MNLIKCSCSNQITTKNALKPIRFVFDDKPLLMVSCKVCKSSFALMNGFKKNEKAK